MTLLDMEGLKNTFQNWDLKAGQLLSHTLACSLAKQLLKLGPWEAVSGDSGSYWAKVTHLATESGSLAVMGLWDRPTPRQKWTAPHWECSQQLGERRGWDTMFSWPKASVKGHVQQADPAFEGKSLRKIG